MSNEHRSKPVPRESYGVYRARRDSDDLAEIQRLVSEHFGRQIGDDELVEMVRQLTGKSDESDTS